MKAFTVNIKKDFIEKNEWVKKAGVTEDEAYEVLGTVGDKLLLRVGREFLEIFSKNLIFHGLL